MPSKLFLLAGFQLALTPLLIILPFISATPSPSQPLQRGLLDRERVIQQRDSTPVLPPGWNYLGCYLDSPGVRTLTMSSFTDTTNITTIELCVNFCNNQHNIFAGLEYGVDCYCGDVMTYGGARAPDSNLCSYPCAGDITETCGGNNTLSTYSSGANPPPQPPSFPSVGPWKYVGCYNDLNDERALNVPTTVIGGQYNMTIENCVNMCGAGGYSKAGVEFANECYCGNSIHTGRVKMDDENCMVLGCSGNNVEFCGAANAIVVYSDD